MGSHGTDQWLGRSQCPCLEPTQCVKALLGCTEPEQTAQKMGFLITLHEVKLEFALVCSQSEAAPVREPGDAPSAGSHSNATLPVWLSLAGFTPANP